MGELLLKSPDFAGLRERYDVTGRKAATKTFQHPEAGRITLAFQGLAQEGTPGRRRGVCTAQPGTPDHDAMLLLDLAAAPGRPVSRRGRDGPVRRGAPGGWSVGSAAARKGGALLCQWLNGTGLG